MSNSDFTKFMIARGLKRLLETKSFTDVTVGDIARHCKMSRNTFYYHFKDKYDVVEYILKKELIEPARALVSCDMLEEAIRMMLVTMKKDKGFYLRVLKIGEDRIFHHIVLQLLKELILDVIEWEPTTSLKMKNASVNIYMVISIIYIITL